MTKTDEQDQENFVEKDNIKTGHGKHGKRKRWEWRSREQ